MSTLTSSSTWAEIQAAYKDNASYFEDQSAAKAAAFITACEFILLYRPKRTAHGGREGEEIEFDPAVIAEQRNQAKQWLAQNRVPGGGVLHPSFVNFRD